MYISHEHTFTSLITLHPPLLTFLIAPEENLTSQKKKKHDNT